LVSPQVLRRVEQSVHPFLHSFTHFLIFSSLVSRLLLFTYFSQRSHPSSFGFASHASFVFSVPHSLQPLQHGSLKQKAFVCVQSLHKLSLKLPLFTLLDSFEVDVEEGVIKTTLTIIRVRLKRRVMMIPFMISSYAFDVGLAKFPQKCLFLTPLPKFNSGQKNKNI